MTVVWDSRGINCLKEKKLLDFVFATLYVITTDNKNTKNSLKLAAETEIKCGIGAHHLKQPPQKETLANLGRARKIELVAQSRSKDKVIHV